MEQHFAELAGIRSGVINIGSSGYFCAYFLPEVIRGYCRLNPKCRINVTETDISGMDAGLRTGQFDITMDVEALDPEMFESVTLGYEYMIMAVPASFAVNEKLKEFQSLQGIESWSGVFWMKRCVRWTFPKSRKNHF